MGGRGGSQVPADLAEALAATVGPLRDLARARGVTQAQLARGLWCDRSRVSRALSGREVPSRQLLQRIAGELGVDVEETDDRWQEVDRIRRRARVRRTAVGGLPGNLVGYDHLLRALGDLIQGAGLSHRQLVQQDQSCTLRRSTVGAVLRGQRSASRDVVIAIVRACGVDDDSCLAAWEDAWLRFGRPHRAEQYQRQVTGYRQRRYVQALCRQDVREIWRWR